MGVVYQKGQELGESDLRAIFTDRTGTPVTTYTIRYSIYLVNGDGTFTSLGSTLNRQTPEASSTAGKYWVDWVIPGGQPAGCYQIRWDYRASATDPWGQRRLNFQIVKYPTTAVRTALLSDLSDTPIVIVT